MRPRSYSFPRPTRPELASLKSVVFSKNKHSPTSKSQEHDKLNYFKKIEFTRPGFPQELYHFLQTLYVMIKDADPTIASFISAWLKRIKPVATPKPCNNETSYSNILPQLKDTFSDSVVNLKKYLHFFCKEVKNHIKNEISTKNTVEKFEDELQQLSFSYGDEEYPIEEIHKKAIKAWELELALTSLPLNSSRAIVDFREWARTANLYGGIFPTHRKKGCNTPSQHKNLLAPLPVDVTAEMKNILHTFNLRKLKISNSLKSKITFEDVKSNPNKIFLYFTHELLMNIFKAKQKALYEYDI